MHRLVVLLDQPANLVSALLLRAVLAAVAQRSDVTMAGIVVRKPKSYRRLWRRHVLGMVRQKIHVVLGGEPWVRYPVPWPLHVRQLARRGGFAVLVPPSRNLNDPQFVARLRDELRPTMALTFLCGQRYRPALLDALSYSANYHNGALPNYRGVYATNWSIYQNEPTTGFTFHRMDAELDEGPILLAGEVPISADANLWEVEHEKTLAAAGCVPQVLAMMVQRAPGTPQVGEGRYFSGLACRRMRTIPDPRALSGEELQRRARAFAALTLPVRGRWCKVARLVEVPGNGDIESADGRYFRAGYRKACPPPAGL